MPFTYDFINCIKITDVVFSPTRHSWRIGEYPNDALYFCVRKCETFLIGSVGVCQSELFYYVYFLYFRCVVTLPRVYSSCVNAQYSFRMSVAECYKLYVIGTDVRAKYFTANSAWEKNVPIFISIFLMFTLVFNENSQLINSWHLNPLNFLPEINWTLPLKISDNNVAKAYLGRKIFSSNQ